VKIEGEVEERGTLLRFEPENHDRSKWEEERRVNADKG